MEIRKSITVRRPLEATFTAFTAEIGRWWPLQQFSYGGARAKELHLECQVGGRLYELLTDGTEYIIGTVTEYEEPHLLSFTWGHASGSTTVAVRFSAVPEGTLVELNHYGWERAGTPERAVANFDQGWTFILQRFGQLVEA